MTPRGNGNSGSSDGSEDGFPDQTVDFASEILNTPPAELPGRIHRLSPDMRTTVLAEVARRYQQMAREKEASDRELEKVKYHAGRLEEMLLEAAKKQEK